MEYSGEIFYKCNCGNILKIGFHRILVQDFETDLFHNYVIYSYYFCPHCKQMIKFDETFRIQNT